MKHQLKRAAFLCSAIFIASYTNPSIAQDIAPNSGVESKLKTDEIENIVVTGTRQAYQGDFDIMEIPQAELSLSSEILKNAGSLDLVQALDLSASVARQNNFGGLWNSFAIRGFVGDENLPSNFLVNGFNAGRGFGGPRDLSGVESVDVLKGPRAALFGRGEPGGTINLVTKRPTFDQATELRLLAGSFDTFRGDFDWDTPLSDSIALRLVGFYEDANSFRDTVKTNKLGFSPSVAFRLTDRSQLVYELEYSNQEIPFDRGVVAIDNELGQLSENTFLGEPGDGPIETEVVGHQLEFQHELNNGWSLLAGVNFRDTSLAGAATEPDFFGSRQFLSLDGETLTRFFRERDFDATYQVFRAELSGDFQTGGLRHSFIIGADLDDFENDQIVLRARGSSIDTTASLESQLQALGESNLIINVFDPVFGQFDTPEPIDNIDRVETQESFGFFIQDQISLSEKWDIRIGARFDDYEQQLVNRLSDTVSDFSDTRVSPQFGVVYQANDSLSIYGAYGENFRPLSGATATNGLDPNESASAEIGVKFALNDGALNGTIAIFDVDQSNIATVDASFTPTAIGAAGSQGLELDLWGNITDSLGILFSYAFIDAETENAFNDMNFGVEVPAGANLLNIPENQATLQLNYDMPVAGRDLRLTTNIVYVDSRNGFFSNQDFNLPSYTTVQLAANYQVSELLELRAEVNNLFDEQFFTNSFADVWVQPGEPTAARIYATFRF